MPKSIAPNLWEKVKAFFDQTEITETGDDKGVIFLDQLSVGKPGDGKEVVFGEGDSFPVSKAYHYNTADETGTTITGATDITTILKSDSGSFVDMFEANLANEVLLLGCDQNQFLGIKNKYNALGDLGTGNFVLEYLDNTDTWQDLKFMCTSADYPYTRTGWAMAQATSEQVRFGLGILDPNFTDWVSRNLTINTVTESRFWIRFRLVTPVPVMASIEQVKLHTNRTEINASGTVEFFGLSRGIRDLIAPSYANAASDPINEDVTYFTGGLAGGIAKLTDNELNGNALDSRMLIVKIDDDLDTSSPLLISYPFYVKGINTGDIEFTLEYQQITNDFVYGSTVTPDGSISKIVPVISPSNLERQVVQFEIPIDEVDPNVGGVAIVISRDAQGTNPNDTLIDNVVLTGDNARGRRWRL